MTLFGESDLPAATGNSIRSAAVIHRHRCSASGRCSNQAASATMSASNDVAMGQVGSWTSVPPDGRLPQSGHLGPAGCPLRRRLAGTVDQTPRPVRPPQSRSPNTIPIDATRGCREGVKARHGRRGTRRPEAEVRRSAPGVTRIKARVPGRRAPIFVLVYESSRLPPGRRLVPQADIRGQKRTPSIESRTWRVTVTEQRQAAELTWIFRPASTRAERVQALTGSPVHGTGPVLPDGEAEVVLGDGTRLRATPAEIVAEQRPSQ